jgi:hypothetical protein
MAAREASGGFIYWWLGTSGCRRFLLAPSSMRKLLPMTRLPWTGVAASVRAEKPFLLVQVLLHPCCSVQTLQTVKRGGGKRFKPAVIGVVTRTA